MPRFYETTLSITNLHNLSISTHVNRSRMDKSKNVFTLFVLLLHLPILFLHIEHLYKVGNGDLLG